MSNLCVCAFCLCLLVFKKLIYLVHKQSLNIFNHLKNTTNTLFGVSSTVTLRGELKNPKCYKCLASQSVIIMEGSTASLKEKELHGNFYPIATTI